MKFQVGDVVQLRSGGPLMTVVFMALGPDGAPMVDCIWFDKADKKEATFPAATLEPVEQVE
jgi:uncharacterized protein YodC (DUF2158 family)